MMKSIFSRRYPEDKYKIYIAMRLKKDLILAATRKGLLIFSRGITGWEFCGDHFVGARVSYACSDQRSGRIWACLDHGHWGNKLHFSNDSGEIGPRFQHRRIPKAKKSRKAWKPTSSICGSFNQDIHQNPKRF